VTYRSGGTELEFRVAGDLVAHAETLASDADAEVTVEPITTVEV
jgi:hypothetical protein